MKEGVCSYEKDYDVSPFDFCDFYIISGCGKLYFTDDLFTYCPKCGKNTIIKEGEGGRK